MKIGFDNEKYLKMQSEHIKGRIAEFGDKLYLEFGGKLFDDYHASRVLPGFRPDAKLAMLMQLSDYAGACTWAAWSSPITRASTARNSSRPSWRSRTSKCTSTIPSKATPPTSP